MEVLRRAETDTLEKHISSMRLRWFGHVARMPSDRLPRYMAEWVPPHGKRNRGRPRKSWQKVVEEDYNHLTGSAGTTYTQMKTLAADRKLWKQQLDAAGNSAVT